VQHDPPKVEPDAAASVGLAVGASTGGSAASTQPTTVVIDILTLHLSEDVSGSAQPLIRVGRPTQTHGP